MSRRNFLRAAGTAAVAVELGGCARSGSTSDIRRSDTFSVLNKDVQAVRNYNAFSPSNHATPSFGLVYEQLVRLDALHGARIRPWLASGWEFSDGGRTLTFTARRGVTFSDGTPMTADDIFYTLQLPLKHAELTASGVDYTGVHMAGPDKVALTFDEPSYQNLVECVNVRVIPRHIWQHQDPVKWTNPNPVGTGPAVLESFSSQQSTFRRRKGYWGGDLPMEYVRYPCATEDAAKLMLIDGELDLATIAWPGATQHYVPRDPRKYRYNPPPAGGSEGVAFNLTTPPWNDVRVRRAMSLAIDRKVVSRVMNDGQLPMYVTNLDDRIYRDWIAPEYRGKVQQLDVAGARHELQQAGWSVQNGRLVKDGRAHRVSMRFCNDYPAWHIESAVLVDQWRKHLGLDVELIAQPGATFFNQVNAGHFDIALWFCGNGTSMYQSYHSIMDPALSVPAGKVATGNPGRWNDLATKKLLAGMRQTDHEPTLQKLGHQLQKIVVEQVPFVPNVSGNMWCVINQSYWTDWPDDRTSKMVAADSGPDLVLMLQQLKRVNQA